jgi:hypothetical protein
MAIVLTTTARDLLTDAFVDELNNGTIEFQTVGDSEVATVTFGATAFGASTTGVATANAIASDTSATGGTIEHSTWKKSDTTEMVETTVTATGGGGDITIPTLTIGAGSTVGISSLTWTQPAS